MGNIVIAYVPVLHRGYIDFFERVGRDGILLIPDKSITDEIEYIWRDMRALKQNEIVAALKPFGIFSEIRIVDMASLIVLSCNKHIFMPREDISARIAELLPEGADVVFDDVFLRWNNFNVRREQTVFWDREIDESGFLSDIIGLSNLQRTRSSDWWRQVGAVVFKNGKILLAAYNRHLPTELEPYYSGDPRTVFKAGESIEVSSAIHAEAAIIAEAAKRGLALEGSSMYVSTFPCPPCANSISQTGIKALYVMDGYSLLSAKEVFARYGIEIVKVNKKDPGH